MFRKSTLAILLLVCVSNVTPAAERRSPEKWKDAIAKLDTQEAPKHGIVFVGSSSIRMWDIKKSFPDRVAINRGFGGSIIADSIHYLDTLVLKHEPRIVVLYAGDNDIAIGMTPEDVVEDYKTFVAKVHKQLPETKIAFIAIKPSMARWKLLEPLRKANAAIKQIAEENERLSFVDIDSPMIGEDGKPKPELFIKDGLHLSEKGYKLWSDLVRPHLRVTEAAAAR